MVTDVATQQPDTRGMSKTISAAPPRTDATLTRYESEEKGSSSDQPSNAVQLYLLFWCPVPPVPVAPRVQSSLDGGTPSLFLQQKEGFFLWSALQTCAAWLSALHIKHPGLSVCAQAAATKSAFPAWSARILASSSAQDEITKQQQTWLLFSGLGEEQATVEGKLGQIKFAPFAVSTRNRLFGSFAQRCGSLILFISAIKFFLLISVEF